MLKYVKLLYYINLTFLNTSMYCQSKLTPYLYRMINAQLITEQITNNRVISKNSYYFQLNSSTVRVSNHLPNRCNWENNENSNKALFVFVGLDMNENEIEKQLFNEFGKDFEFNFFIANEKLDEYDLLLINNMTK